MTKNASGNHRQTLHPSEAIQVVLVDWLPKDGQAWLLYKDLDLVAVSSHLDTVGREMALTDAGVLGSS